MHRQILCLTLFLVASVLYADNQLADERSALVESQTDLNNTLENARVVPYLKDGKLEGYVVDSPTADNEKLKVKRGDRLELERSNVVTAPNDGEGSQE